MIFSGRYLKIEERDREHSYTKLVFNSLPNKACATLMILVQKYCLRWIQRKGNSEAHNVFFQMSNKD